ncbi:hypothetical protein KRR38_25185 [Novosphingobium sp. G106]|uniref:hypothetical protein n=1 Tax=Novosphingobium sp. G106 TaxID=2849500 RepID=UPI001C2D716F|nr:hypothetical protein [Novosphingobium sp. G106]MBV1690881.1 hypothetical protein [Novosphingobium sp. G106]
MTKPQGLVCSNWRAECGCTIYDTRPQACRSFDCGWRRLAELGDRWRPDRSGILINFRSMSESADGVAAHLIVIGGEQVARSGNLAALAASLVDGGTPTHLVIPGPSGNAGHQVQLNGPLKDAVAAKSLDRAHKSILDLVEALPKSVPTTRIRMSLSYR